MVVTGRPLSVWSLLGMGKARKESLPRNREEFVVTVDIGADMGAVVVT